MKAFLCVHPSTPRSFTYESTPGFVPARQNPLNTAARPLKGRGWALEVNKPSRDEDNKTLIRRKHCFGRYK